MAVVQISRIQIRRGRKNQGSGLPQLASGEFAWAIDSQQLFIGNGSVAEGAPYVGNTQILTEHDDLFAYAANYTYRSDDNFIQTGSSVNSPVQRTLQDRLDDIVSVRSFGALGDNTNQTAAVQRAIDQLYLNPANSTNPQSRVILVLEPGRYNFTNTIYIPPFATIRGAGKNKTVITSTASGPVFQTVNGTSGIGSPANDSVSTTLNQARNIELSGMTINVAANKIGFQIQSCKDSLFKDLEFIGTWNNLDIVNANHTAIRLNSLSGAVTNKNNIFDSISIRKFSYGVYSDYDIFSNTWSNCKFETLGYGIRFGEGTILGLPGQEIGPYNNMICESEFRDIDRHGLFITEGTGNSSNSNRYYNVGNAGGNDANAAYPVIEFITNKNISENDWFERSEKLGYDAAFFLNVPYVPNVKGPTIFQENYTYYRNITEYGEFTKFLKLPAETLKGYEIDYIYKSNQVDAMRKGTLDIVVNPTTNNNGISDSYEFLGNSFYETKLTFSVQNYDENGDGNVDTIAVMMLNLTTSDDADFTFRIKTKS